ncbi:MAG TPA: carboxypeptidase-like regulatory domain-containing protein [Bacteroidales bacterium]|nr:carboxypeptidase-like regulatory domain-containing protein [Bacteroidales bacterium]
MRKVFIQILLITGSALISGHMYAQNAGKIKGQIIDKTTKETLSGATVSVVGTNYKTISDMDGNFAIENLGKGDYKIEVSYISYQTVSNTVEVKDSSAPELQITMSPVEPILSKEAETMVLRELISENNSSI